MRSQTQAALVTLLLAATLLASVYGNAVKGKELTAVKEQVDTLQASVQAKQETITKMTADVQNLGKQMADKDATITELRKTVAGTETELKDTKEELEKTKQSLKDAETRLKQQPVRLASTRTLTGFEVTWYNGSGTTKSGKQTKDGVTVSVDPRVIPLGTWVELVMPDGTVLKRRADDTGSAVKGKVLDVYSSASTSELRKRGRTYGVTVRIID